MYIFSVYITFTILPSPLGHRVDVQNFLNNPGYKERESYLKGCKQGLFSEVETRVCLWSTPVLCLEGNVLVDFLVKKNTFSELGGHVELNCSVIMRLSLG